MNPEIKITGIYTRKSGTLEHSINCGEFIKGLGLKGDSQTKKRSLQLSFFSASIKKEIVKIQNKGFCMLKFLENITIENMQDLNLKPGMFLQVGSSIQRVTKIGKDCFPDCPAYSKNKDCIMIDAVFFTEVIQSGKAYVGDIIKPLK